MIQQEGVQPETDAITRVIADATNGMINRDYGTWAGAYLHAPHIRRVGGWSHGGDNWSQGGVFVQEGWNEIWPQVRQFFEEWPYPVYPHGTRCENWNLRVGRDSAWATFDQYPLDATGRPAPALFGFLRETRMLEKHDGVWKIAYLSFFHEMPLTADQALVRVDESATIVTMSRTAAELIGDSETLCVRNGRLRATDEDVDLRLRATIREAARAGPWTNGAVQVPFLLKTPWGSSDCVCWIASSLDMKANAMVSLGNTAASRRRLQNAVLVYRLSPAQARLAEKIAEGHDLVAAAERLGVTVNTARTHLHRMFEKTGVRSQPALVGALLSVAAPVE